MDWIPFGGAIGCLIAQRFITRRVGRILQEELAMKPSPPEWRLVKARISGYRLGLYTMAAIGGAVVGAGIGALAFLR